MKTQILCSIVASFLVGQLAASAQRPSVVQFASATVTVYEYQPAAVLDLTRSGNLEATVTVEYTTHDVTAQAGQDFEAVAGTLTFAPGAAYQRITIPLLNDGVHESQETLLVTLRNPTGGLALGSPATVTVHIVDNDPGVALYGDGAWEGAGTLMVSVWRGNDGDFPFTVDYATTDGTAQAGLDYQSVAGTLTFAAGEANQTIAIPILNDGLRETNETFRLTLSHPTGGAFLGSQASVLVTILDNDAGTRVLGQSVPEIQRELRLTVERGNDVNLGAFTVDYATTDGTAKAGLDYEAAAGTLGFAAGESHQTITITILNDGLREGTETFRVTLSNPTADALLASPASATVEILDNDPGPHFAETALYLGEDGREVILTVRRGNDGNLGPFTVDFATVNGGAPLESPAVSGWDYEAASGTLHFAEGERTKAISVRILNDGDSEGPEFFRVRLSQATGGFSLPTWGATATVRIEDNDPGPHFAERDNRVAEGAGFIDLVVFRGSDGDLPARAVDVVIHSVAWSGTPDAQAGLDYEVPAGRVEFAPGASTATLRIPILPDDLDEGDEGLEIALKDANGPLTSAFLRIIDDDGPLRWTLVNQFPLPSQTRGIGFGAGIFVATAWDPLIESAALGTSEDGVHWARQPLPDGRFELGDVAYGNGRFVAVGGSSVGGGLVTLVSSNAVDWSFAAGHPSVSGGADTRVLFANDRFVVWGVGSSGASILASVDGLTWAATELLWPVSSIAAGSGAFVAVGEGGMLRSVDGRVWTELESPLPTPLASVAFGDGVFLAVSRYDEQKQQLRLLSSPNALDWQVQTVLGLEYIGTSGLAFIGGAFVGGSLRIARQGDGWQVERTGIDGLTDAAAGHGVLVGINPYFGRLRVSSDGRTWAELSVPLHELAFGNRVFVAAGGSTFKGSSGGVFSSVNSSDWAARATSSSTEIRSLAYGNGRFVAIPVWGRMQTSTDGLKWSEHESPFGPNHGPPAVVAFGGARFVALEQSGSGPLRSAVSGDGVNWTIGENALRLNGYFPGRSLAYGNGRFLAIDASGTGPGTVLSSEDGLRWTRSGFVEADRLILAGEQFLAWHSAGGAQVWTSPDGVQWTGHPLNMDYYPVSDIAYGGGLYVAIVPQWDPPSPVLVSRDLKQWRAYSPPVSPVLHGSVFKNGRFHLLGDNSTIFRSNPVIHLSAPEVTDSGARLTFTAESGRDYELQTSRDLVRWESLAMIRATQDRIEYLDRTDLGTSPRFYRVILREAP
jgi:hypothetical protein